MSPRCVSSCAVVLTWFSVAGVQAQHESPAGYYDAARNLTGVALKAALATRIKGHTVLPYTSTATDTWDALMFLDEDPGDPASVVLTYSGLTNLKTNNYTGGVGAGKWSREHLFPQSYGIVARSASSRARTDLFNLRPVDYTVNSTRGDLYYDTTTTPFRVTAGAPGSSYDIDSWEPRDDDKGVVARAAFYMATRYDGSDADVQDLGLSDTPNPATCSASLRRFWPGIAVTRRPHRNASATSSSTTSSNTTGTRSSTTPPTRSACFSAKPHTTPGAPSCSATRRPEIRVPPTPLTPMAMA